MQPSYSGSVSKLSKQTTRSKCTYLEATSRAEFGVCFLLAALLAYSPTLKREGSIFFKKSVHFL
jgi:hypothetical protein